MQKGNARRTPRLPTIVLVALALASIAPRARADQAGELGSAAHAWFDGERQSGYLWGGAGLLSLGAAGSLHRLGKGSDLERGMAYPIASFGLLQALIGVGSLARGSGREDAFDALVASSPAEAREREAARMRTLRLAFLGIEIAELALVVGGASFAATRSGEGQALSRGVGLGLAVEGGAMLFLDSLAAERASLYAGRLESLTVSLSPAPGAFGPSLSGLF